MAAKESDDPAERLKLYTRAEELLVVEDPALMVLYYPARNTLTKPYLQRTFSTYRVEALWKWDIV